MGTGNIARQFARGLHMCARARLAAVGSRSTDKARQFAAEFRVARSHGSCNALAADDAVDIVYIATPHACHRDNTLLCLNAGKAVLCEKPLAINVRQGHEMVQLAQRRRLFLMEAMWTRFLPPMVEVRRLVTEGIIGDITLIAADLGFDLPVNPEGRLFNPELGGGCLLDVGVYPINLATMFLGAPSGITGYARVGSTRVDEQNVVALAYGSGALASLYTSIRAQTPHEAIIVGTRGIVRLHPHWWRGGSFSVHEKKNFRKFDIPMEGDGYQYEAAEVQRCLLAGRKESPAMPLAESLVVLQVMDELRRQWDVQYPME
jgi:predicted dehydrogenase